METSHSSCFLPLRSLIKTYRTVDNRRRAPPHDNTLQHSFLVRAVDVFCRADMVDEYIAMGKTLGIAEHNERRLHKEGKDAVKSAFEATLALQ